MAPRKTDTQVPDAAQFKQDPDLWFADGSIVVVAQGTGFRVHMSLLSRASPVLRDMFNLPQPTPGDTTSSGGTQQGVRVVHVSDSAHDMRCMLHAIYTRKYLADMVPNIPFAVLSAHIRLGHKYELTEIADEAAHYLEDYFTADFDIWLGRSESEEPINFYFSEGGEAELYECVKLMRLTGKTAMLPHTFYKICQLGLGGLLNGGERDDGTYDHLYPDDVEHCMFGHVRLVYLSSNLLPALEAAAACVPECVSQEACLQRIRLLVQAAVMKIPTLLTTNALAGLEDRLTSIVALDCWTDLCGACRDRLVETYLTTQREIWKKLPSLFSLEDEDLGIIWAGCSTAWYTRIH